MLANITKLLSASAIGQLIAFLFIPLLTHVFEPEVFGQYQVAFSIALFMAILLTWKLEVALPTLSQSETKNHVLNVSKLILANALLLAFVLALVLTQSTELFEYVVEPTTAVFSLLIALAMAFNNLFRFYLIEKKKFGVISLLLFCQSGGRTVLQWLLQFLPNLGLMLGDLFARLVMLAVSLSLFIKEQKDGQGIALKRTILKLWRYPVWVMPSTLLNSSMAILLIPLIAFKFGAVEAGVVAVAYRLITAPNSLIGAAIADVLFARLTELSKNGHYTKLRTEFIKVSIALLILSIAGFGVLYFLSDYLDFLLANEYGDASRYLIVLIPWFAAQFMVTPLTRVIFIFDKQAVKFIIDLLIFANLLVLMFVFDGTDIFEFLYLVSVNMAAIYLAYLVLIYFVVLTNTKMEMKNV